MKKVLFLVPHLSTGGMPQYTFDLMRKIKDEVQVYCVEYSMISPDFVVQRNRIIDLLGERFTCLGNDKNELFEVIDTIQPDIIHLQEVPEYFLDTEISTKLYAKNRNYLIVETSHDSSFSATNKRFYPDHFALISEYQRNEFSKLGIPIDLIEADIEYKERQDRTKGLLKLGLDPSLKHVLNVGLFTPRKNQAEAIEYARSLQDYPIQFHFVGNQADNFKDYWEPLFQNLPSNVKIWGERSDVDDFYSCMDMMLFTSRGTGNDKETSPLVIRESIGYNLPSLIFNLPVYLGMYDDFETIRYMNFNDKLENTKLMIETLGFTQNKKSTTFETLNGLIDFESFNYPNSMYETIQMYGDAAGMWWGTFVFKELERGNVTIENGDVFVDLGANIGISSHYAAKAGASKIYCFEPDKHVLSLLEKNIGSSCSTFNYAISNKRETIKLYHWPYNPVNEGPQYTVETVTLEDVFQLVDEPVIDYLKMDIEGFEDTVFDNVSQNVLGRIRKMFIEHHYADRTSVLVNTLEKNGFDVFVEYGNGQNYLYCVNKNLSLYDKNFGNVSYDSTDNKITYNVSRTSQNSLVSVKDIDSQSVIWSVKHDSIYPNVFYWVIPIPKGGYDFETQIDFGGFIIDFYEEGKLISSKSTRMRTPSIKKEITKVINNSEPTFFNYNEFFVEKIYNKFLHGKTFDTVVDVGANVGLWTEYIQSISNVNKVYMVEPNVNAIEILKKTYDNIKNISIVECAMSNLDGEIELFSRDDNSLVSSIVTENKQGNIMGDLYRSSKINSIRFDTFLREYGITHIDLIKVDIESAEYDLFDSMTHDDFKIIDNILVEYHLNDGRTLDTDVNNLINKFVQFGFSCDLNTIHGTGGFIFARKDSFETDMSSNTFTNRIHSNTREQFTFFFNKTATNTKSNIGIITLNDSYYKELAEISVPNKIRYAEKHGYDFIHFYDIIDKNRPPQWSKIKAIEYALNEYEWVWWIDIDAMIMNMDIKLESILDNNFDIILTENKYSTISNGSSFFKNTELTKRFLKECYELDRDILKEIDINTFDHEQKPMRTLYLMDKTYSERIKLIDERICNSYWYTKNESVISNYPNWNNDSNIYEDGDFVVNFCGRTKDERIVVMNTFDKISKS